MKKTISILLIMVMLVGALGACSSESSDSDSSEESSQDAVSEDGESASDGLPEMTTDEITLTYMNFDNEVLTEYLAEQFMELYPNITVEIIYHDADDEYNDTLLNLVSAGQVPDAFMLLGNCDFALTNDLLGDMTEYWENDPDNENILPSIDGAQLGYYGTDKKLATPMKFFPAAVYADMSVFESQNVEMPSTNWTWDEMIQSFKDITSPDDGIYGFNQYYSLVTFYPIAVNDQAIGEFGWDGNEFDMTDWAVGVDTLAEMINGKYMAPTDEEERIAWLGADIWAGFSGKIGY